MMKIRNTILKFLKNEEGMGVVEVVLIILVLVGLALLFKNQITTITNGIFTTIKEQIKSF